MGLKTHGITSKTIKQLMLGAGALYKNLKYDTSGGWTGEPFAATSGGLKFNYEGVYIDVEIDGANVLVKGVSKQKVGEKASLEGAVTEFGENLLIDAWHLIKDPSNSMSDYDVYVSKENITEEDYQDNVGFVGKLSSGKNVIIIVPNAICLEAAAIDAKNATQQTYSVVFQGTADIDQDDLDTLDVKIYYPK